MGAAVDSKVCAETIFNQVASVGQLALNIATFGTSSGAASAANAGKNAGKAATLTKKLTQLKDSIKANKNIAKVAEQAKKFKKLKENGEKIKEAYDKAADAADALENVAALSEGTVTDADIVRVSAQVAALADPTGVASIVEAYSYPICSQIFKKWSKPSQ